MHRNRTVKPRDVGLPLANVFLRVNFRILGFDIDPRKIDDIIEGVIRTAD